MTDFTQAIVREPSSRLDEGLSLEHHAPVNIANALKQHKAYINLLTQCDVEVTTLPPLDDFPDSCFVEDVAVLTKNFAVITRPGALSRINETKTIEEPISRFFNQSNCHVIETPGTLDGGDVLQIDKHFYVGLSSRSNQAGIEAFSRIVSTYGYGVSTVALKEGLHLKTFSSYVGDQTLLLSGPLKDNPAFASFQCINIDDEETYAANSIRVNKQVIIAAHYPKTLEQLNQKGFSVSTVDTSEFKKVDGGLSCLSLRF